MQAQTLTADNWHGNDLLLLKIGRNWLQGHGYINASHAGSKPSSRTALTYQLRSRTVASPQPLHPAVMRRCWDNSLTDPQWDAIQNVLILVSRILDDPVILEYFNRILSVDKHVRIDDNTARHLKAQYPDENPVSFVTQGFGNDRARRRLWKTTRDMADSVKWKFGGNASGT